MTTDVKVNLLHIGICTSDLQRSLRFYTEALGFVHEREVGEIGPPFDKLIELPGQSLTAHHVSCDGLRLELISFSDVVGSGERCPMNQLGFTHMTLTVDDIEATCDRIEQFGGRAHRETQIDSPYGPIVFCTDPDGLRIELMHPFG
ncbi:VOC family protein [Aestuariicella hydrocarbonica]|uniref:VOC family protein n=1 Tax=Pseudomaricurvus hydrocarbonicus TaxID=1470433 RepID=A0A9E5MHN1_9GAMM|nr:VOC family protein [Aestuariicella hydrocarbonica]NHO66156.1 VOC family protein [Aestuariicella hydrocarbonica]